jgi:A/G-specific adenine glycosylase
VTPYYEAFITLWPTVKKRAAADPDDVMAAWAGLGYYTRARNLIKCAQVVAEDLGGKFPSTEEGQMELPGVGVYTAAAVAAIAFDVPTTVVDGNVDRVMVRFFGIEEPIAKSKSAIRQGARALTPEERPGDYAQAVMDLGATVCTPTTPSCHICPWAEPCTARAKGIAGDLPVKTKPTKRPIRRGVAFWLTRRDGSVLIRRRPPHGLLGGMLEVPTSEWRTGRLDTKAHLKEAPVKAKLTRVPGHVTHTFTHFHLELQVYVGEIDGRRSYGETARWMSPTEVEEGGLPTVMKKVARLVGEA